MGFNLIPAAIAIFGLLIASHALRQFRHGHVLRGCGEGLCGCVLLSVAVSVGGVALNLYSYQRLMAEAELASINVQREAVQQYRVALVTQDGDETSWLVFGDEWQLDARVIKWRGWASLLGLNMHARLERLSGRYRDVDEDRTKVRSVYALAENPGIDLWAVAREYQRWLPVVDTTYGSAAYMPLADGAEYRVSAAASGVIARPTNEVAKAAVAGWR